MEVSVKPVVAKGRVAAGDHAHPAIRSFPLLSERPFYRNAGGGPNSMSGFDPKGFTGWATLASDPAVPWERTCLAARPFLFGLPWNSKRHKKSAQRSFPRKAPIWRRFLNLRRSPISVRNTMAQIGPTPFNFESSFTFPRCNAAAWASVRSYSEPRHDSGSRSRLTHRKARTPGPRPPMQTRSAPGAEMLAASVQQSLPSGSPDYFQTSAFQQHPCLKTPSTASFCRVNRNQPEDTCAWPDLLRMGFGNVLVRQLNFPAPIPSRQLAFSFSPW